MTGFVIYCVVSGFLGFCGFVDAWHQPRRAWKNAGRSKLLWVLITMLGMLSVVAGSVTWALYSYGGTRRAIVGAGATTVAAPILGHEPETAPNGRSAGC